MVAPSKKVKTASSEAVENSESPDEGSVIQKHSPSDYEFTIYNSSGSSKKDTMKNYLPIKFGVSEFVPVVDEKYNFNAFTYDIIEDIKENQRVCLVGHTGCGKTSCIEQIAARVNQPVSRVNLNGQLTIGDFVGMWTVKAGETVWVDGVLPKAMRDGHWLILDELDFGDTGILSLLNPVLEKNGKLTLKEKGHEVVHAHADFRIFATANTIGCMQVFRHLYQGTNIMNEAFLDRFRVYLVDYMKVDQERDMLMHIFKERFAIKAAKTLASVDKEQLAKNFKRAEPEINALTTKMVTVANAVREEFLKGGSLECTFSTRRLIDWMEMTVRHENPRKAAINCIFSKISEFNKETINGYMNRDLPTDETIKILFEKLRGVMAMTPEEEKEEMKKILHVVRMAIYKKKGYTEEEIKKKNNPDTAKALNEVLESHLNFANDVRVLFKKKEISFNLTSEIFLDFFKVFVEAMADTPTEDLPYFAGKTVIEPLVAKKDYPEILQCLKKRLGSAVD